MTPLSLLYKALPLALLVLLAASCGTSDCTEGSSTVPRAAFYSGSSQVSVDSVCVKGIGAPGDSVLLGDCSVSELTLPLRAAASSTSFSFDFGQGLVDTLTLTYESKPTFISKECGVAYYYEISDCSATTNVIDSVSLPNGGLVTNEDRTDIIIYLSST